MKLLQDRWPEFVFALSFIPVLLGAPWATLLAFPLACLLWMSWGLFFREAFKK